MSTESNLKIVRGVYEAFARTDILAVLAALDDDVEWIMPGPPETLPFAGVWRGRDAVSRFLAILTGTLSFEQFEPRTFLADADTVVVLGHSRDRILATGRIVEMEWAAVITLRDGKVIRYQVYEDTAAFVEALRDESAS